MLTIILTGVYIKFVYYVQSLRINLSKNKLFQKIRFIHNLLMVLFSFSMLICIFYGYYLDDKYTNVHTLLCKDNNNSITEITYKLFFYSKFYEWLDTLFLVLSNKPVRFIHISHHSIVPFLTSLNLKGSHGIIFIGTNTLVHTLMYMYYACPNVLKPIKRIITYLQILQHIIAFSVTVYVTFLTNCEHAQGLGNMFAIFSYSLFIILFSNLAFKYETLKMLTTPTPNI